MKIHPTAEVQTNKIGENTQVWQYSIILKGAEIGRNCNINCHVFIENDVKIGDKVTVKSGVQLWDGLRIENDVFIGPNVTFTNDERPRSKQYPEAFQKTYLKKYSSLGAASVVLGGITIGEYAMVGAGSVVTKSVPDRALVAGNPARRVAWLNKDGSKMNREGDFYIDSKGKKWIVTDNILKKL